MTLEAAARLSRRLPPWRSKARLGRAAAWGASLLGARPLRRVALTDGTLVVVDIRSRTESQVFWNGAFEETYLRVLKALHANAGGALFDIGANVGLLALPLARHAATGRGHVYAFEAVPENAERLVAAAELNGILGRSLTVANVALGATEREADFVREVAYGASTGNAMLASEHDTRLAGRRRVAVRRLDDVRIDLGLPLPTVVKMDVEGMEEEVLLGARETLLAARPIILGEFNSLLMPRFSSSFTSAFKALPASYRVFGFRDAHSLVELQPRDGMGDVLLVPEERLDELPLPAVGAES